MPRFMNKYILLLSTSEALPGEMNAYFIGDELGHISHPTAVYRAIIVAMK